MHPQLFAAVVSSLWIFSLWGFGIPLNRLLANALGKAEQKQAALGISGLLGIIFVTWFGELCNFFIPLTETFSLGIYLVGTVAFLFQSKTFLHNLSRVEFLFCIILLFFLTFLVIRSISIYDSGFYHLPATKWIKESPVPFGLANLLGRLGLNSSWWVFGAIFWLPGFGIPAAFVTNVVFVFFFVLVLLEEITGRKNNVVTISDFFVLALFLFLSITNRLLGYFISGISPDPSILHLGALIPYFVLKSFYRDEDKYYHAALALILATFLLTVKASGLPLLGEAGLAFAWIFLTRKFRLPLPKLLLPVSLSLLIAIPWAIRGFVMSGCWFQPFAISCFPKVEWSQSLQKIATFVKDTQQWAMISGGAPAEMYANYNWFPQWFSKFLSDRIVRQLLAVSLLGMVLVGFGCYKKSFRKNLWGSFFVILMSLLSLTSWFLYAPEPRYAYCYMVAISFVLLSLGLSQVNLIVKFVEKQGRSFALAFAIIAFIAKPIRLPSAPDEKLGVASWPHIPSVIPQIKYTPQGIAITSPLPETDQCWDFPLPCTADLNKNLKIKSKAGRRMFYVEH